MARHPSRRGSFFEAAAQADLGGQGAARVGADERCGGGGVLGLDGAGDELWRRNASDLGGDVYAVVAAPDGAALVVGRSSGSPWMGRVSGDGEVLWSYEATGRRAQPLKRLDLVVHKLTGEDASRGQGARQQLGYLAKLRNALVHFDVPIAGLRTRWATPEEAREEGVDDLAVTTQEFQPPRWLRALESKALLLSVADKEAGAQMDWSLRVCSREVADWAVSTVVDAMAQLANSAADGSSLRRFLVEETGGGSSAW